MTSVEIKNWTSEYYITNQPACQSILGNPGILREIPLLNNAELHYIRDKQLVRFRGMVQDMYDPEYYFKQYEVRNMKTGESNIRCGMYTDAAQCLPHEEISFESNKNENSERQTYIVMSTPGLNDWAKEKSTNVEQFNIGAMHSNSIGKRSRDDNDSEEMDCLEPITKKEKLLADNDIEKTTNNHNVKNGVLSEDYILNFPIPIDGGKACIVKCYDGTTLKLNQIVDVIGFISLDPMLSTIRGSEDEMNEAEINAHNPPASLIPRLHAIKIIDLREPKIVNAPEIISKAQLIRDDLHMILSQLLFGDNLAADYLLCHLLSTIYMRRDYFCLGTFPLNVTNLQVDKLKTFPKDFYNFLTLLVKKSHFLEVTLDNLNELALIPKKDYECNRLTSGILQLSDNTHLVIDETGLTAGELTMTGKQNYRALSDLLMFQKVIYDFKYYTMEYETDIPILIFSDVKSFIPCPMQIILTIDAESENLYPRTIEAAYQYLKDENRLANIRQYLEVLSHTEFVFNEEITKIVQDDFAQIRSVNKNIGADNLHALMVFARLMSLSYGQTSLSIECWKKSLQLEIERMSRLPQRGRQLVIQECGRSDHNIRCIKQ